MKKQWIVCMLLVLFLTACSGKDPKPSSPAAGRMVQTISIAVTPEDEAQVRVYETQENLNAILGFLRHMPADEELTEELTVEPELNEEDGYYTIQATFANGEQNVWHLLGNTYLRMGDEPWSLVDQKEAAAFVTYLQEHLSDDGSAPEASTAPAETTAPPTT